MSFVVTIDGPAGAGKSTTARAVASALGFLYVDTGALYRAFALKVSERGVTPDDDEALAALGRDTRMTLTGAPNAAHVFLDGVDVSGAIRTPAVSELSSRLAARPAVRRRLVEIQRALAGDSPVVAEGRDLGTVVFPDAEVKIYLDADLETRVGRRHRELVERGLAVSLEDVRADVAQRDERDRTRAASPLAVAPGAEVVDTSGLDVAAQVEKVLEVIRRHPGFPGAQAAGSPPGGAQA